MLCLFRRCGREAAAHHLQMSSCGCTKRLQRGDGHSLLPYSRATQSPWVVALRRLFSAQWWARSRWAYRS